MSHSISKELALQEIAHLKRKYWKLIPLEIKSNPGKMDEAIRGFSSFVASELGVQIIKVGGLIDHPADDPLEVDPRDVHGFLQQYGARKTAYVTGNSPESRRYSTAHELAHVLLGDQGTQHRIRNHREPQVEAVAEEILMPRKHLRNAFIQVFGRPIVADRNDELFIRLYAYSRLSPPFSLPAKTIAFQTALLAAKISAFDRKNGFESLHLRFGVSPTAMAHRLINLGLIESTSSDHQVGSHHDTRSQPSAAHKSVLTESLQNRMNASVSDFLSWLPPRLGVSAFAPREIVFAPPSSEDWVMRLGDREEIIFNPHILTKCTPEFFELVIIHEIFHLYVQHLPNKEDATRLKDAFGDATMRLFDVEADVYAAWYLKDRRGRTLRDILFLYHQGASAFSDRWVRVVKFERFIGSILSIVNLYETHAANKTSFTCDIFLPAIQNVQTEESLSILVRRRSNLCSLARRVTRQELQDIQTCYTNPQRYPLEVYANKLEAFAQRVVRT